MIQKENQMYKSIEQCLQKNFSCKITKRECIIASKLIDKENNEKDERFKTSKIIPYKSKPRVDVIGYCPQSKSLYIVECKVYTDLGGVGIATAVGQAIINKQILLTFGFDDLKNNLGLKENDEIKNLYVYICVPDFPKIPEDKPEVIRQIISPAVKKIVKELNQQYGIGLLRVYDINQPAEVFISPK